MWGSKYRRLPATFETCVKAWMQENLYRIGEVLLVNPQHRGRYLLNLTCVLKRRQNKIRLHNRAGRETKLVSRFCSLE